MISAYTIAIYVLAQLTMFSRLQRLLGKRDMCISMRSHYNELYIRIRKEILCGSVMRHVGKINSAVHALINGSWVCRLLRSLEDCDDFVVWNCVDERKVEAFCREAVADHAYFDWRHGSWTGI
jgi:hypothetical protein